LSAEVSTKAEERRWKEEKKMAGIVGKVLFTRWTRAGFGNQLNWHGRLLNKAITRSTAGPSRIGEVAAVDQSDLAARIGLVFKRIEGGDFIYQRQPAQIETFAGAETSFTIGMLKKLLELKEDRVRAIFSQPNYSVEQVLRNSYGAIAKDVPEAEQDNCPLVTTDGYEEAAIAELVGATVMTERQWERAAAGTDGRLRPWGNDLDHDKAVYWDPDGINGTRPVKLKPAGVSGEGLYDLIGNVWERTKERVLRGGSWGSHSPGRLRAQARYEYYPEDRDDRIGFRLARTIK